MHDQLSIMYTMKKTYLDINIFQRDGLFHSFHNSFRISE